MHPDVFDFVLFATVVVLILGLMRVSYQLGLDDGWEQSGRWADEYIAPNAFHRAPELAEERAAARHDSDVVAERTYPYRGEVE
jgi:hypothetical protein